MTRNEIGKWMVDASMGDVLAVLSVGFTVLRSRMAMLADRPEMAAREAEVLDEAGIRDVRTTFDHDSYRGVPGCREFLDAVAVEAKRRGLE